MKIPNLVTAGTISAAILSLFVIHSYTKINDLELALAKAQQTQTKQFLNFDTALSSLALSVSDRTAEYNELTDKLERTDSVVTDIQALDEKIVTVIKDAWQPVVTVVSEGTDDQRNPNSGHGTGFIISVEGDDAYIITNHHVIERALDPENKLELAVYTAQEPWRYAVTIVGSDKYADIAVLKITKQEQEEWVAAEWADHTETKTGDWIVSVGHGFGLRYTVSQGMITYTHRFGAQPLQAMIQHDAAINPGNSGGPIFNLDGKVVGVNDMILSASSRNGQTGGWDGISLAVAGWHAELVYNRIRESGVMEYPDTDFEVRISTLEEVNGVPQEERDWYLLSEIEEGERGWEAGMRNDDVLVSVAGIEVTSYAQYFKTLLEQAPNSLVMITVKRDGELLELPYRLGKI